MNGDLLGDFAIVDERRGISISTEERLALALSQPNHPLALSQGQAKKVTANRIRAAFAELSHEKVARVSQWLEDVAAKDPARAIELFIDLAQFSLPKLKAIAVDVKSSDGSVKTMSVQQLEALVAEDATVVSEQ